MFKTIKEEHVEAEIVEKKSKFIANIFYVNTTEMAEDVIKKTNKKYFDARHNCYAYSIKNINENVKRFSDDGEPSGTAGAPILNIIEKNEINNILVIVTRYFGGILLGTGGLVRAYSEATMRALERVTYANEECGMEMLITISYSDFENFKYFCRKKNISIINTTYNKYIECTIEVNNEEKQNIIDNNEKNNFNILNNKVIKEKNIRKNIEI